MKPIARLFAFAGTVLSVAAVAPAEQVRIQGAGATFPQPLYERWVAEYQKAHPDVKIDYQGIGSGGGIKGITDKTIDFAGSDAPLSKKEIEALGGADAVVEVPSCAGGVVPAYNLPGIQQDVHFTGEILAEIYMGKINRWDDAKLQKINAGVKLPGLAISPAYRTDGSGTNYVWTNYLATQSGAFKNTVGVGKQVKWPVGQGGKGNQGVAQIVQQTPGALGYLEQNFANKNKIQYGAVQNKSGQFVKASPQAVSAAGEGATKALNGHVVAADIWNQPGEQAYPIASFTYLIVYRNLANVKNEQQAQALADYLWWATHDGQELAAELDYAPLSKGVQQKVEAALKSIDRKGVEVGGGAAPASAHR